MKLRNKQTREIIDLEVGRITDSGYGSSILLFPVAAVNESYAYTSLAELNEEWEDCQPQEPLIKDEKIRKAVRAWAEAVGKEETFIVSYNLEYHDCCIYTASPSNTALIDFGTDLNIKEGSYTFDELCGEEEE